MKTIFNKISATRAFGFLSILFAMVLTLASCSDDLDVQQSYPFTVEVMPFGSKISKGETVELRFEIKPEETTRTRSILSATFSMTVKERSSSLTARCW